MLRVRRENGPLFVIMGVVMLLGLASLAGGAVMWRDKGLDDNTLILLLFGAIVVVFVIAGVAISVCSQPVVPPGSPPSPVSDPPPKYRETWRIEYLEFAARTAGTNDETVITEARRSRKKSLGQDIKIWMSSITPRVHGNSSRTSSLSIVGDVPAREGYPDLTSIAGGSGTAGRVGRSSSTPDNFPSSHDRHYDDGLPSYDQATGR